MNTDSFNNNHELRDLMSNGLLEVPHLDFEDKVMQKVIMASTRKTVVRKNLRISWIFLILSIVLFPLAFIIVYNNVDFSLLPQFGDTLNKAVDIFLPAMILIFSVIILIQIDNLLRLTNRIRTS
jgi:hypothetical protein